MNITGGEVRAFLWRKVIVGQRRLQSILFLIFTVIYFRMYNKGIHSGVPVFLIWLVSFKRSWEIDTILTPLSLLSRAYWAKHPFRRAPPLTWCCHVAVKASFHPAESKPQVHSVFLKLCGSFLIALETASELNSTMHKLTTKKGANSVKMPLSSFLSFVGRLFLIPASRHAGYPGVQPPDTPVRKQNFIIY